MIYTLYFLRSSEQKIAKDMSVIAYNKELSELEIYYKNYGLTPSDIGLYALVENEIAGGAWVRLIDKKATLSIAVKPKFQGSKVGSQMLNQLFLELGGVYKTLHVELNEDDKKSIFFEKFGFVRQDKLTLVKQIKNEQVLRPTDGYDPSRWIE